MAKLFHVGRAALFKGVCSVCGKHFEILSNAKIVYLYDGFAACLVSYCGLPTLCNLLEQSKLSYISEVSV